MGQLSLIGAPESDSGARQTAREQPAPAADWGLRFWSKVEKTESCWNWKASLDSSGYGQFHVCRILGRAVVRRAHRIAYELVIGAIPVGLQLDHLCRNRKCVNPDHLEPVTNKVNGLRGTSPAARNAKVTVCPKGHEYTPDNTRIKWRNGASHRDCKKCHCIRETARNKSKRNGIS